jgi:hypothetical protein
MRGRLMAGAAGLAVLVLAGCGGDHDDNDFTVPGGAVRLQSTSDALRELGNISTTTDLVNVGSGSSSSAALSAVLPRTIPVFGSRPLAHSQPRSVGMAARAALLPRAVTSCPAGGSDNLESGSKSHDFVTYSDVLPVSYELHTYSGCATGNTDGSLTTLDNQLEAGSIPDGTLAYVLSGSGNTPLRMRTSTTSGNDSFLADQALLGFLEINYATDSVETRAVLNTTLDVKETGFSDYHGVFTLGSEHTFYSLSGNNTLLEIEGDYAYGSNVDGCSGGAVTVSTVGVIGLGSTSAGSGLPVSGGLTVVSGNGKVTFTFNADGSATLSGSVNGTLDAGSVGQVLQNGSSC